MASAEAMRRGVNALLQTVGGECVQLRVPSPPVAGDLGEELGLRTPLFTVLQVTGVAVRKTAAKTEVLVSPDVLESVLNVSGAGAVTTAMQAVEAVLIGDEAFLPTATEWIESGGKVCLYRLVLETAGTEVV